MSTGDREGAGGQPPASYFLGEYGTCALGPECQCLAVPGRPGAHRPWLGRACPLWKPLGAQSHDDLLKHARRVWEERKR